MQGRDNVFKDPSPFEGSQCPFSCFAKVALGIRRKNRHCWKFGLSFLSFRSPAGWEDFVSVFEPFASLCLVLHARIKLNQDSSYWFKNCLGHLSSCFFHSNAFGLQDAAVEYSVLIQGLAIRRRISHSLRHTWSSIHLSVAGHSEKCSGLMPGALYQTDRTVLQVSDFQLLALSKYGEEMWRST